MDENLVKAVFLVTTTFSVEHVFEGTNVSFGIIFWLDQLILLAILTWLHILELLLSMTSILLVSAASDAWNHTKHKRNGDHSTEHKDYANSCL